MHLVPFFEAFEAKLDAVLDAFQAGGPAPDGLLNDAWNHPAVVALRNGRVNVVSATMEEGRLRITLHRSRDARRAERILEVLPGPFVVQIFVEGS